MRPSPAWQYTTSQTRIDRFILYLGRHAVDIPRDLVFQVHTGTRVCSSSSSTVSGLTPTEMFALATPESTIYRCKEMAFTILLMFILLLLVTLA
jgi:hypothetical protein